MLAQTSDAQWSASETADTDVAVLQSVLEPYRDTGWRNIPEADHAVVAETAFLIFATRCSQRSFDDLREALASMLHQTEDWNTIPPRVAVLAAYFSDLTDAQLARLQEHQQAGHVVALFRMVQLLRVRPLREARGADQLILGKQNVSLYRMNVSRDLVERLVSIGIDKPIARRIIWHSVDRSFAVEVSQIRTVMDSIDRRFMHVWLLGKSTLAWIEERLDIIEWLLSQELSSTRASWGMAYLTWFEEEFKAHDEFGLSDDLARHVRNRVHTLSEKADLVQKSTPVLLEYTRTHDPKEYAEKALTHGENAMALEMILVR